MKLNVNGEQLPLISSNDVIMNGSLDKTLTDVIDDHTEEINNLEKNIKWLYKYGGTGSKGGSGGGGSYAPEINLNCDIVFDGQVISFSNENPTIILKNSDITTSNISLSLKKYNGLINYKVTSITQVNNLRQSQSPKSICSTTILNSDNNYSLSCVVPEIYDEGKITIKLNATSTVTGEGDNKQYTITYIKNPYLIELNIANGNDEIIQGTDIYVDDAKRNGLKLQINYKLQSSNPIPFEINDDGLFETKSGIINEDGFGKGVVSLNILDEFINNDYSIGYNAFTVIFDIPRDESIGQEQKYLTYSVSFNFIPKNEKFFKILPVKENAKIYKYSSESYEQAYINYEKYDKYYKAYSSLSNGIELDDAEKASIITELNLDQNISNELLINYINNHLLMLDNVNYMFGVGSIAFNIWAYFGTQTTGSIDIKCKLSAPNSEILENINLGINTVPLRTRQTISFVVHEPGIYIMQLYSDESTENKISYYFYVYNKLSNIDWYDSSLKPKLQTYYRSGNVTSAFSQYYGQKYIQQYANGTERTLVDITNNVIESNLDGVEDVLVSIGLQYSSINNDMLPLFTISTNDTSSVCDLDIYQNKIIVGKESKNPISIFIPKESKYNVSSDGNYHLLNIYKRFIYSKEDVSKYEICVYLDGALEGAYYSFIKDSTGWRNIKLYKGNYAINLVEISYFAHNDLQNAQRLDGRDLTYLDDIAISEYYYKYVSNYKEDLSLVPSFNGVKNILNTLRNFTETEQGMIKVGDVIDVDNIAKEFNVPVLLFTYTETNKYDFVKTFIRPYEEDYLSDVEFSLDNLKYASGKKELQTVNIPTEISNAKWYIKLQGSSTGKFFCKNLTLGLRYGGGGYMPIFTPNFIDHDFKTDKVSDEAINAKNSFLPEKAFTLKADCVDSSHSNNTAVGKFVNTNTTPFDIIFKGDEDGEVINTETCNYVNYIKNCLLGFPVLVFIDVHYGLDNDVYFLGIYNFNLGRDSYFNMGYYSPKVLDSDKINEDLHGLKGDEFKVTYVQLSGDDVDLAISDEVIVAEIQGGHEYYDFSQYDQTILVPQIAGDKGAMFGDFVPSYNAVGNTPKDNKIRLHLQRLVQYIAKGGGYIFEDILGKHLGEYPYKYNKYIDNGENTSIFDSANQVPNYKVQYVRKITNNKDLEYTVNKNQILEVGDKHILSFNNTKGSIGDLTKLICSSPEEGLSPILDYTSTAEYYTACMAFGLVDSVMKNLNVKTWDAEYKNDSTLESITKGKWYIAFYDMDTSFGRDNEGNKVSYFAFSDYWTSASTSSDDNSLHPAIIYRDFFPKEDPANPYTNGQSGDYDGFDVPSSYLFAVAKYASLVYPNHEIDNYSIPQNIWARWRNTNTNAQVLSSIGTRGVGSLKNANDFIKNYFIRNLDEIPEQLWNMNYRFKYLKCFEEVTDNSSDFPYRKAINQESFRDKDFLPFHGKGINELVEWLTGRFHILDAYFNTDGSTYKMQKLEYTYASESDSSNELIPILDENYETVAWKWQDLQVPKRFGSGAPMWVDLNYDDIIPAANGDGLMSNNDIIILRDIFNNSGVQYKNDVLLYVKAKELSPLVITNARGNKTKYLLNDPNKEYIVYAQNTGIQNTKFGGSPLWTNIRDLNTVIHNGKLTINSDILESFVITNGTCTDYNIANMRALKTVHIERKDDDEKSSFTGSLSFVKQDNIDSYPDLTSITLIRTNISLTVDGEGVRTINLRGTGSENTNLYIRRCPNLENVILNNTTFNICEINPGWTNNVIIQNTTIKNLTIAPKDETANNTSLIILNNNALQSLHIKGFKKVKISNCSVLNEITIDDPQNIESLQLIQCNTAKDEDGKYNLLRILNGAGTEFSDAQEKSINMNQFTNLKEINFNGTFGFYVLDMHELMGQEYISNNGTIYNVIRLIGPAFENTEMKSIISYSDFDSQTTLPRNNNLYLMIDYNNESNSTTTGTFHNSYFGSDGYTIYNNFLVPRHITSLANLFYNGYLDALNPRVGGISNNEAEIILGNNTTPHQFKFIYEDKNNIVDISNMFRGQNVSCQNQTDIQKLSLATFLSVTNISGIYALCKGFTFLSNKLFELTNEGITKTLSSETISLNIDSFATNISSIVENSFKPIINKISGIKFSGGYYSILINKVYNENGDLVSNSPINLGKLLFAGINQSNKITEISGIKIDQNVSIDWENLFTYLDPDTDEPYIDPITNDTIPKMPRLIKLAQSFNHEQKNKLGTIYNNNVNAIGLKNLSKERIEIIDSLKIENENDPINYNELHKLNILNTSILVNNNALTLYKYIENIDALQNYINEYNDINIVNLDYAFSNVILRTDNTENIELKLDNDLNLNTSYNFKSMCHTFENFKAKNSGYTVPFIISQNTLRKFKKVTAWAYAFSKTVLYQNLPLNMFNLNTYNGNDNTVKYKAENYRSNRIIYSMNNMFSNVKITKKSWFDHNEYLTDEELSYYNSPLNGTYSYYIQTPLRLRLTNEECVDTTYNESTSSYEYTGENISNHLILPFDIFYGCSNNCDINECFADSQFEGIMPDNIFNDTAINNTEGRFMSTFRNLLVIPNYVGVHKYRLYDYNGDPEDDILNIPQLDTYVFIPSNFTKIDNLSQAFNFKILLPASNQAFMIFNYDSINLNSTSIDLSHSLPGDQQDTLMGKLYKRYLNESIQDVSPMFNPSDYHNIIYGIMLPDSSKLEAVYNDIVGLKENILGLDRIDLGLNYNEGLKGTFDTAGYIFNSLLITLVYGALVNVYNQNDKSFNSFNINTLSNTQIEKKKPFLKLESTTYFDEDHNPIGSIGVGKFTLLPNFTYNQSNQKYKYAIEFSTRSMPLITLLNTPNRDAYDSYQNLYSLEE